MHPYETKHAKPIIISLLAIIVALWGVSVSDARIEESLSSPSPLPVGADSIADGPYILSKGDSDYLMLYVCNGDIVNRILKVSDAMNLRGMYNDSATTYPIRVTSCCDSDSANGISRILAVSDIHGEYGHLLSLLKVSGVVDSIGRWSWGDGHLVIVGDIFDSGDSVTECLWFLYRLEAEAKKSGGNVHIMLGNHELMVLRGDYRYVNEKYTRGIVVKSGRTLQELYDKRSVIGNWLRTKNCIVKLNNILFVHGGVSSSILPLRQANSLAAINNSIRGCIDSPLEKLKADSVMSFLMGSQSPLWYRGFHEDKPGVYSKATREQVDSVLSYFDVTTVVVGHTEVSEVEGSYDGKVIAIDVPVEELHSLQGLLWKEGRFFRLRGDGRIELIR